MGYRQVPAAPTKKPDANRPPIRVALPLANSVIALNANLLIRSDIASDKDFKAVECYIDDQKVGETNGAPWTFVWMAKAGQHRVHLKVIFKNHQSFASDAVSFRVE